jgi:predicted DNA-binding protein (MmcQ/YjbR family)
MNKTLHDFLMNLPEAVLDYPFGADIHVYKVEGKVFAIYFKDDKSERINLKCDPVHAQELRAVFSEVTPGYHEQKALEYLGLNGRPTQKRNPSPD